MMDSWNVLARRVMTQHAQAAQQQVHDADIERHAAQQATVVSHQRRGVVQRAQHGKRQCG